MDVASELKNQVNAKLAIPFRYVFLLIVCAILAITPWALTAINYPLPPDLRLTGTALAATRTAWMVPSQELETADLMPQVVNSYSPTTVFSLTPSSTPTITPTSTISLTPTTTPTPTPLVLGVASKAVRTYSCPGDEFREGVLEEGIVFTILGWDETADGDRVVTWILIEDEVGHPQIWIKESEQLILTIPGYKGFLPRVVCRTTF